MVFTYEGDTVEHSAIVGFCPVWPLMGSQAPPTASRIPWRAPHRGQWVHLWEVQLAAGPGAEAAGPAGGARLGMGRISALGLPGPKQHQSLLLSWTRMHEAACKQSLGLACRVPGQEVEACDGGPRREMLRREAAALRPMHCPMILVAAAEWMEGPEAWQ